jgi:uncharacterized protein (DUF58 family)
MMTGKGILLFALALALFLFGLASLNGGVIALTIPLLVYLGLGYLQRPDALQLRAVRRVSVGRTSVEEPVAVTLTVTNNGQPLREVLVQDILAAKLELIEGATGVFTPLGSGDAAELSYVVRGGRGAYQFQHVQVTVYDGFDLFRRQILLPAPALLVVQPTVQRMRAIPIRPPRTRGFAGPIPARQGGSGVDFFAVRDYQLGDRLRWVNWRVTARNDRRVYSNVFEQERIADVGLILDAREGSDVRIGPATGAGDSLFEHSVRAAASLAEAFLNDGNRVGLLIYGSGIESVFPGYGRVQRERILRALGRAATGHHFVFEKLDSLPTRFFPAQSQIVFVGPVTADDPAMLIHLRALGYALMVVSPNPVAFEAGAPSLRLSSSHAVQYAHRIATAERTFNLQRLRRVGVQVVDWDVSLPLGNVIHEALARQPAARATLARLP